jgi:hypothetical protein
MILYVIIGLALASFVITFLSAKTWHWGYVILVEAIFLTSVGLFILAAETLRINAVLRKQVTAQEKQLDQFKADNDALLNGTGDGTILGRLQNMDPPTRMPEGATSIPSLENLNHELLLATRLRGRVWRYASPAGVDAATGAVRINFVAPPRPVNPNPDATAEAGPAPTAPPAAPVTGLKADTVVYVFEDSLPGPQPPNAPPKQFIGEFTVVQAAGQTATLQPVQPLKAEDLEMRRLAASRGPWTLYEAMPMDRYEIYAGMTDQQLQQLLPKQSIDEYLKHGKEATADDDPRRKVGFDADGKRLPVEEIDKAAKVLYERRLRDYAAEFDEAATRRVTMLAQVDALQKDIAQLTAADAVAKKTETARTVERQKLTADLAGVTKEREAMDKHLADVQQLLAKAKQLTDDVMARNRQLAAKLAGGSSSQPKGDGGANRPARQPLPLAGTK